MRKSAPILIWLTFGLIASGLFFMTFHANGNWDFILPFRGKKLLLLLTIAYTIGISTLLFHELVHQTKAWKNNHIIYLSSSAYLAAGSVEQMRLDLNNIKQAFSK